MTKISASAAVHHTTQEPNLSGVPLTPLPKKHVFFSAETSFCYSSTTSSKASAKPSSEIDNKDTEIESAAAANLPRCARTDGRRWQCQQLVAGCGQRYCSKHSKHTRKKGKPVVKILSAFRGVAWDKKAQKWRAEITIVSTAAA